MKDSTKNVRTICITTIILYLLWLCAHGQAALIGHIVFGIIVVIAIIIFIGIMAV